MFGVADIVEMVDMTGSRGEGYRWRDDTFFVIQRG